MAKAATDDTSATGKPAKTGKPGKAVVAAAPAGPLARLGQYLRDVRAEMGRVVWPTRVEVLNSSVVVITTLIFFIVFIMLVDFMVLPMIKFIAAIKIGG
jgi:preprotein translocase subunit SecE